MAQQAVPAAQAGAGDTASRLASLTAEEPPVETIGEGETAPAALPKAPAGGAAAHWGAAADGGAAAHGGGAAVPAAMSAPPGISAGPPLLRAAVARLPPRKRRGHVARLPPVTMQCKSPLPHPLQM